MMIALASLCLLIQEDLCTHARLEVQEELSVRRQVWASIPWETSLSAARARATREGKPIFLQVNTGNALGFV